MRRMLGFALAAALLVGTGTFGFGEDDKPKYTIKEVMKEAMKGGLCKKVVSGDASQEEKDKLAAMFTALTMNKPPKGEEKAWKEKTTAMMEAAKGIAKDDKDATAKLKKLVNCMACHNAFKG